MSSSIKDCMRKRSVRRKVTPLLRSQKMRASTLLIWKCASTMTSIFLRMISSTQNMKHLIKPFDISVNWPWETTFPSFAGITLLQLLNINLSRFGIWSTFQQVMRKIMTLQRADQAQMKNRPLQMLQIRKKKRKIKVMAQLWRREEKKGRKRLLKDSIR